MATALAPPVTAPEAAVCKSLTYPIVSRVFARIGLLGNPSDGYFGKTIAFSLANYYAEVCEQ